MLPTSGRRIDMSTPFVDATMPDGSRLHVVIPDITRRHMAGSIRMHVLQAHSLDELVTLGTLPPNVARFLEAAVAAGLSILVPGGTQDRQDELPHLIEEVVPGDADGLAAVERRVDRLGAVRHQHWADLPTERESGPRASSS
jgi:pilus assembly protein CpaF